MLLVAAAVLAAEALALLVYTVLNLVAIATNNSYQVANGVALIIMQVIVMVGLAWMAYGIVRLRPWTRTPSVLVQVFIGIMAIILFQAHRYDWGLPLLLLAILGLVGLLVPASLKALARPVPGPESEPERQAPARGNSVTANSAKAKGPGSAARSGNPAKRNPAGKPVSRQS
jgi:hypothetical protein